MSSSCTLASLSLLLIAFVLSSRTVESFLVPSTVVRKHLGSLRTLKDLDQTTAEKYEFEEFEYSRFLSEKEERADVLSEGEEFGYKRPLWQKALRYPFRVVGKAKKKRPGALILLRCGQSTFNANQTFTGWLDPDLTDQGVQECQHAGRLLLAEGYEPEVVYTSRLQRAIKSVVTILEEIDALYTPVFKTYRLNQRMYGAVQGLSKEETVRQLGRKGADKIVKAWRNSLKAKPPPLSKSDPSHPVHDRRYADISEDQIPSSETLLECQERARPLWEHKIRSDIKKGKNVLVVAHRDTLRGFAKVIDGISDDDIQEVMVPTGIPFVYRFDKNMKPIKASEGSLTQVHTSATFLEKPGLLKAALQRQKEWSSFVSNVETSNITSHTSSLEDSLLRLREEQNLLQTVESFEEEDSVKLVEGAETKVPTQRWTDDPSEFEEYDFFSINEEKDVPVNIVSMPAPQDPSASANEGPFVVLIRHGRTPHNNMGLFTGWEDPPLATRGVEDARNAGRLLKRHGFEFDVVYTSWLTRAIQTAYYCLDELDMVWLPIVKSWRLNERMYGALTGKSKKMVANEHGEDQLVKWRRGYTIRPPPTSSYSLSYPGNDLRRAKHVTDLRISWTESLSRSLEQRKPVIHRKFPKTESLKDCMDRSIPFYTKKIRQEAVDKGKRVLITSHENAIRGILMHLCDIPQDAMNQLHLPNGLPLVYNVKGKCITLLDDGSGKDPMEVHDFGPAAKYLFKPCELDDEFFESMLKRA